MPRVLVVDDDDVMRMLMLRLLQTLNCEVSEARNGIEAERVADQFSPNLILLDIMMPLQDGYETCTNLRGKGYEGMIVMCSSLQEQREKTRTQSAGANGFVQKPFNRDSIWPYLNELRGREAPLFQGNPLS